MKKLFALSSLMIISAALFFSSCSKDEDPVLPTITFKQAQGYVSSNTAAKYGDTLVFGITTTSNGTDNLAKFEIFANETSIFDTTLNTNTLSFDFYSLKSILDKEVWKFVVTDIAGNTKTDSITITGNFGEILTYPTVTFGAQNNTTVESFASYSNSTVTMYFQSQAFLHQADIDMFCFYENTATHQNLMTLAAPGSNITGIFSGDSSPDKYSIKNLTYFEKSTLTSAQFDAVANDAVILATFNPDPSLKRKKASVLTAGDVYAFQIASGKFGLFKVITTEGTETGTLQIAVKIQK